jgi:hypothetical protein
MQAVKSMEGLVDSFVRGFHTIIEAAAGLASLEALKGATEQMLEAGKNLSNLSNRTQASIPSLVAIGQLLEDSAAVRTRRES